MNFRSHLRVMQMHHLRRSMENFKEAYRTKRGIEMGADGLPLNCPQELRDMIERIKEAGAEVTVLPNELGGDITIAEPSPDELRRKRKKVH